MDRYFKFDLNENVNNSCTTWVKLDVARPFKTSNCIDYFGLEQVLPTKSIRKQGGRGGNP